MPQHGVRDEHADRVDCDVLRPAVAAAPVAAAAKSAATVAAALAAAVVVRLFRLRGAQPWLS